MVETDSRADVQIAEVHIVLNKDGLFAVITGIVKRKVQWRRWIENRMAVNLSGLCRSNSFREIHDPERLR